MSFLNKNSKIFLAGHKGLVGSAILTKLKKKGYKKIITVDKKSLDLRDQKRVFFFLNKIKPKVVIIAAAKVGGILANNKFRAEFIYDNLTIQNNLIHGSYISGVKNLIFLGSSCAYPKNSKQPMKEEYLLSGYLEKTNEPYALAKIAGIKMCENYNLQYKTNYKCLMPANSFGPNDNYNSYNSHFFQALIKKAYEAKLKNKKNITLWGTGKVKRELVFSEDIADAVIYFLNKKTKHSLINIGSGMEKTIKEYAQFVLNYLNLDIKILLDRSKPDGVRRKILDISVAKSYGWYPKTNFKTGFVIALNHFIKAFVK
jgi:GDP-L-fucose synthase